MHLVHDRSVRINGRENGDWQVKSRICRRVLNNTIYTLITNCTKADGVRNYFDVGVIGYGGNGVGQGLGGALLDNIIHPITDFEKSPLRIEDRTRLDDDGAGGILERRIKFPVWFDPTSSGGTPMVAGLRIRFVLRVPHKLTLPLSQLAVHKEVFELVRSHPA